MTTKLITLGSDPEIFVFNPENRKITSAAGLLGCNKWDKKFVADDVRIQEDNVLIEFDINPHTNFDAFNSNMQKGIDLCYEEAGKVGLSLAEGISSHIFTDEEIRSFHASALEFGCEPDYNALTGMRNPKPAAADAGLRTAGGHIHIGFTDVVDVNAETQKILGVMCDYYLGLPSLLLDNDDRRRELYGKAGSCRFKDYGIEYRTLSNFWVTRADNRRWAWDQANKAFNAMSSKQFSELLAMADPDLVQTIINTNNKALAEEYVRMMEIM
ncbi:COOH.NH2 ligase [Aeromonas phage BUCT695]|uniref:COOH.NH2 ligase n=1 Tax=Aeromonas phage BUCT695 TaxID=2908630 RepID=UPI0023293D61|nr:COOH.NH2 ligase [Aeromonas phage BUCT695]UIW10515.1 hypothetical protein [Aeromonas phage BUCT695]